MSTPDKNKDKKMNSWKKYFDLGPVFGYFFRKKDAGRKSNFNTKVMHGINKISIIMFLIAVLVLLYRAFFR